MEAKPAFRPLTGPWRARKAAEAAEGLAITAPGYALDGWIPAVVPGSVCATLVENRSGECPDTYLEDTTRYDIAKLGAAYYTYWFHTTFCLPEGCAGRRVWLQLDGVNYRADVYLNGQRLEPRTLEGEPPPDGAGSPTVGMFLRWRCDVTSLAAAGGECRLAVRVSPPDPPGVPTLARNGGEDGPSNIGNCVTARYPVGWDWIVPMPDRSTGIWDHVRVGVTGPVLVESPHVVTRVELQPGGGHRAYLQLAAEVSNATGEAVTGELSYRVEGRSDRLQVTLSPHETRRVVFAEREMSDLRLWWPRSLGEAVLYTATFELHVGGALSDSAVTRFGVRKVELSPVELEGRRAKAFFVNGRRLFLRGGNWIGTDARLRYSTDAKRYHDEVRMHAEANLDLIRVWGGGITERTYFYDACDELGMLVMQDFWISGEYDVAPTPLWTSVFEASARDNIKRLRNHPSLLFWSGGNEQVPPDGVLTALQRWIPGPGGPSAPGADVLDPTRPLVRRSTAISDPDTGQYEDGPYHVMNPALFFPDPPVSRGGDQGYTNPLNPEIGVVGMPTYETLRRIVKGEELPGDEGAPASWTRYKYQPYADARYAVPDQIALYGEPATVEELCDRAQLANYVQYKALFEGYTSQLGKSYAGVFLWKSQSPWPSLYAQLYDWYLEQTGIFFGVRHACEPVHVSLNLDTHQILVANTSAGSLSQLTVKAMSCPASGEASEREWPLAALPAGSVAPVPGAVVTVGEPGCVLLRLMDGESVLSRNFYWLAPDGDYRFLKGLPAARVETTVVEPFTRKDGRLAGRVRLCNRSAHVAFWIRLQVRGAEKGAPVLPVFYGDNYVSLVPGEHQDVAIDFAEADVPAGDTPEVVLQGWNVAEIRIAALPVAPG